MFDKMSGGHTIITNLTRYGTVNYYLVSITAKTIFSCTHFQRKQNTGVPAHRYSNKACRRRR